MKRRVTNELKCPNALIYSAIKQHFIITEGCLCFVVLRTLLAAAAAACCCFKTIRICHYHQRSEFVTHFDLFRRQNSKRDIVKFTFVTKVISLFVVHLTFVFSP